MADSPKFLGWRWARRLSQLLFLAAFLYLFRATELGRDALLPYTNLFFRLDPLAAASAMLAARAFIAAMALSIVLLLLTALFGRFFCGWVCPLGTLLDAFGRLLGTRSQFHNAPRRWWRPTRHVLLLAILIAAVFSLPLVGYLDPFALLTRGLAVAVDPALNRAAQGTFTWLYLHAPPAVTHVTEPLYGLVREYMLPFQQAAFSGAAVSAGILCAVFLLELIERRFWCRNVCPLGSLLTFAARFCPLRRQPAVACRDCLQCTSACRMGAFNGQQKLELGACTLCMDCVDDCPRAIAAFHFRLGRGPSRPAPATDFSRRAFLTGCTLGLALPAVLATAQKAGLTPAAAVLRPPGGDGDDFLDLCVRCGQCLKVCPTNGLQPDMSGGLPGLFAPHLVPRMGYCEYNCTLCSQVCPSGAIPPLTLPVKQRTALGLAVFDHNRCLPYAQHTACLVCEEHCPVPDKAIRTRAVEFVAADGSKATVLQPYVVRRLCIGCGICENKCPLEGIAGVRVEAAAGHERRRTRWRGGGNR